MECSVSGTGVVVFLPRYIAGPVGCTSCTWRPRSRCLAARKEDESWRWHERYGHLSFEALHQLGKQEMVRGTPVIKHAEQVCDTCVTTKLRRKPFPQQAQYRA